MKKFDSNIALIGTFVLVLSLVSIAVLPIQNVEAQDISVSTSFRNNPTYQGDANALNFLLSNPNSNQVFITKASIKFEWRQATYDWNGNVGIPSGENRQISIPFDVPSNALVTSHSYTITVTYEYQSSSYQWTNSGTDFKVEEKKVGLSPLIIAVILIALIAVIAVIAVVYLYIKKKPVVHVTQQIQEREPDSPPTRIKLPGERAPSSTRIGAPPSARSSSTAVSGSSVIPSTAAITGAVVLMPNGQTKMFDKEIVLGRKDFEGMVPSDLQNKISREHIKIWSSQGKYYIEDGYQGQPSTNGTKLSGKEIKGLGPQGIKDGDAIKLANAVDITVKLPGGMPSTVVSSSAGSTVMKTAVMSQILELAYEDKNMSWSVTNDLVIGRDEFRGKLLDDKVNMISAKHCRIYREGNKYFIADGIDGNPSTNGTKVNNETFKGNKQLKKGDTITIAGVVTIDVKNIG